MQPELIADYECRVGEGILWHPDEKQIYWIDIPRGRLFRYDPKTGTHEQCYDTDIIGGFTIQSDGSLLLFKDHGEVEIWDDGDIETIIEEIPEERKHDARFNDVIADPRGRVYCGTLSEDDWVGRLYRLDPDGSLIKLLDAVGIPNGMGFTPDHKHFYFTESNAHTIYRYEYHQSTGELSNREVFVESSSVGGNPDGLTVDEEGYVWSARWDSGCVIRYTPDGTEDQRVQFPTKKVSSITLGGSDYTDAYVTTALGPREEGGTKETEGKGAGALYWFTVDVPGLSECRSRIGL